MTAIVAHTNNGYGCVLNEIDHLLDAAAILVSSHSIDFVHQQDLFFGQLRVAAIEVAVECFVGQQFGHLGLQQFLAASIRGVEFDDIKAEVLANQLSGRCFSYAWGT